MARTSLENGIEQWLSAKQTQVEPRFPADCETVYLADTASARLTALKTATLIGIVTGLCLAPAVWQLMPDARWAVLWVWCGVAVPIGLVSYLALWMKLPVKWQELQSMACATLVALAFSVLMTSSVHSMPSVYLGGMTLLIMLDIIAAGFRFRIAVAYSLTLTVMFGIVVQQMPVTKGLYGYVLMLLIATCSVFAVFGAWRVETEMRRSYALMLREQLKQQALSQRNSELDELALRDVLTGLANRRSYESWKMSAWSSAEKAGSALGLLVVDVDNFKLYNDAFGHGGGDACLRAVAHCLSEQLRGTTDMLARVGGEEFAILLPEADLEAASAVAERVRRAVELLDLPHASGAAAPMVTVSCGAASLLAVAGKTPEDLFAAADGALYAAKKNGRNRVCLAEPPTHVSIRTSPTKREADQSTS